MVKSRNTAYRSYLGCMVKEIQLLNDHFETCLFSFTRRSGNMVAHNLGQLAHTEPNMVWKEEVPISINEVYFHDLMN